MRKHWLLRAGAAFTAAVLLAGSVAFAQDEVTEEDIKDLQNKVDQAQNQAQQAAEDVQDDMDDKAQAELQAQMLLNQINSLSDAQAGIQDQIAQCAEQIAATQQSYDETMEEYKAQLQAMQKLGDSGGISLLLQANSLYELLTFPSNLQQLSSYTDSLLTELQTQKQAIQDLSDELEGKRATAAENQQQLEETRKEYQAQVQKLDSQISAGTAEQIAYEAEYEMRKEELQAAEAQLEQQIADALAKAEAQAPSTGLSMTWPLPGYSKLSTHFGEVIYGSAHYAIDIPAPRGTPIVAAADGTVLLAGWNSSYGYWALINHSDGISTVYAHMAEGTLAVSAGQTVAKGQTIGGVGSTGFSSGNHLHFEVRKNGQKVDPLGYVSP